MASSIYATRIINNATSPTEDFINEYNYPIEAGHHIKIGIKKPGGSFSKYVRTGDAPIGKETCTYVPLEKLPTDSRKDLTNLGLEETIEDIKAGGVVVAKITTIFKS